ncbi:hypothetical protein [Verminephrobacter eiseniae]
MIFKQMPGIDAGGEQRVALHVRALPVGVGRHAIATLFSAHFWRGCAITFGGCCGCVVKHLFYDRARKIWPMHFLGN